MTGRNRGVYPLLMLIVVLTLSAPSHAQDKTDMPVYVYVFDGQEEVGDAEVNIVISRGENITETHRTTTDSNGYAMMRFDLNVDDSVFVNASKGDRFDSKRRVVTSSSTVLSFTMQFSSVPSGIYRNQDTVRTIAIFTVTLIFIASLAYVLGRREGKRESKPAFVMKPHMPKILEKRMKEKKEKKFRP